MVDLNKKKKLRRSQIELLIMSSMGVVFLIIFAYLPMVGVSLAFKDANKTLNIWKALLTSPWTFQNFIDMVRDERFWGVFKNTLGINLLSLLINFPAPIIFALLIDQVKNKKYKSSVQTVANFPHFISWVVMGGIVNALTDTSTGIFTETDFNMPQYFWGKMILVSMIKGVGWGSIIYSAAIAGIDPGLYESARIDGANRFQQMIHITLPLITPTITVFLLLNISRLLGNSFEQFYVFQTTANLEKSEVLATLVYQQGFGYRMYSYSAAMSLFDSVISATLLLISTAISKRTTGKGLF